MKNEFNILEKGNQAEAITIINHLEYYNIPFKETNNGIVVLMDKEKFDNLIKEKNGN